MNRLRRHIDDFSMRMRAAGELATPEEARALAEKGADHLSRVGIDQAKRDFEDPQSEWIDRDLYVMVLNDDYKCEVHAARPELTGQNIYDAPDKAGKMTFREFVATRTARWIEYLSSHPVTGALAEKSTYVVRTGPYVVAVGAYKSQGQDDGETTGEATGAPARTQKKTA
jgi:hypothetical protein